MRNAFPVAVSLLALGGCSRILGLEKDYVLREPITANFNGNPVTVASGVAVYGTTSFKALDAAGGVAE